MKFPITNFRVEDLVSEFVKFQCLEIMAQERDDVRSANRYFDGMYAALKALADSQEGRDALEELMEHDLPEVQLRAAGKVMSWAPEKAIPLLGRLIVEWRPKDPKKGYVAVRIEASGWLYDYFGIKDFDRNKLIDPLRTYGIDMPRRSD